jgi:branched-chain amino acid transport system ATP-binding protein
MPIWAAMLSVANLTVSYGSFQAVCNVTLAVRAAELVVLLGANGAGKTTLFRALSGMTRPDAGSAITFAGHDLSALPPRAIVDAGVSHCPEGRKLFPALSVMTNLRLGAYRCRDRPEIERRLARVLSLFPLLSDRLGDAAGALSGGQQQMVAIGRALSPRSAWRRRWCGRCWKRLRPSTAPVQWCSSRSRTRMPRLRSHIAVTCSKRDESCSKGRPAN